MLTLPTRRCLLAEAADAETLSPQRVECLVKKNLSRIQNVAASQVSVQGSAGWSSVHVLLQNQQETGSELHKDLRHKNLQPVVQLNI